MLSTYRVAWLPKDVIAGLVLTALLVRRGWRTRSWPGSPRFTGLLKSRRSSGVSAYTTRLGGKFRIEDDRLERVAQGPFLRAKKP